MKNPFRIPIALFVILGMAGGMAGCASSKKSSRVIQKESGKLEVISTAKDEADAAIAAIDEANKHCEELDKKAIFVDDKLEGGQGDRNVGRRLGILLKKMPVVGRALASDEKAKLAVEFRCK